MQKIRLQSFGMVALLCLKRVWEQIGLWQNLLQQFLLVRITMQYIRILMSCH